jgi:hypothetical protein
MKRLTVGLLATFLASATAGAQVTVKMTAPNVPNGGTVAAFGFYMSPYTGTVNGQQVILNCDDFFHEVKVGDVWQANQTSLANGTNMSDTRFDDLTLYQEAAWLTTQYASNPATNAPETVAIQSAIWDLFQGQTANAPDPAISVINQDNSSWWVQQAQTNYATSGLDYSTFSVLTDVNADTRYDASSKQEFIVHTTPEPGTLVLLATGLFGIVMVVRRRRGASLHQTAAWL